MIKMKIKFKKIMALLAAFATIPTATANALLNYDPGNDLPIIEGCEIAEFFDDAAPDSFGGFYLATDGEMLGSDKIAVLGETLRLTDGGAYPESGHIWVLFYDNGTYDTEDDEIIKIFEYPTDDSAELAIYDEIYSCFMRSER